MTIPKDIEAAEKLLAEVDNFAIPEPWDTEEARTRILAQALAAAREEGRDAERKYIVGHYINQAKEAKKSAAKSMGKSREWQRQNVIDAKRTASEIRNLPTNAPEPEGESDGWNYDMSQAPKSLKDLPDGAMIILAHEAPNGVWWAKTGIWDETSNKFMPIGGSWEPTAFRIITLPTKKGE